MKFGFTILINCLIISAFCQQNTFINPILPGGYPDPSICRVGEDFYIVNSSFEYYPGLPIHHSKDLVNWELIGHGLHRADQCKEETNNLVDVQQRGGIHAPSIRYNNGTYYIITTNVYDPPAKEDHAVMINFIITASDPAGPWSEPHIIEGAPGIDPDIFFDDDGKVYFVGTHAPGNPNQNGIGEIWVQELDLENWMLTGPRTTIWDGACGGCCVEGPHIYKEHGLYYLLVAEGGTGTNHAVMMAASENLTGPYESNPRNPVLTSRHLSLDNWVHSTGHADIVQLEDGRWYMVALGKRGEVDRATNMGRETHLIPVSWEPAIMRWEQVSKDRWEPVKYLWPVAAPETGRILRNTELPFAGKPQYYNDAFHDDFNQTTLGLEWNYRRVPKEGIFRLSENPGNLRVYLQPERIQLRGRYSLVGIRQKESDFNFEASMKFMTDEIDSEAGISVVQQDDNYIMYSVGRKEDGYFLKVYAHGREDTVKTVLEKSIPNYQGNIILKIESEHSSYKYRYSIDHGNTFSFFTESSDDLVLCFGYTGAYLGLYGTSNGTDTEAYADFDWVSYKGFVKN